MQRLGFPCQTAAVINPQQFRLLLAGPRVSRLQPFMTARGYLCDAAGSGELALEHLRATPRHVLLVELELGDMLLPDLLATVNGENLACAVVLLEDPAKAGLIVSTLLRGIDAYVATPPNEEFLFRVVERQLLAQWAMAQAETLQVDGQERARLDKQLNVERAKVTQLVKDLAGLREELAQAQVQASSAAAAAESARAAAESARAAAAAARQPARPEPLDPPAFIEPDDGAYRTHERTAPRGYERGEIEALLSADSDAVPTRPTMKAVPKTSDIDALGFEEQIRTGAGLDANDPSDAFEVKSESDLFLDLDAEEPGEEPTRAGLPPTSPTGAAAPAARHGKPIADPFEDPLDD